MSFADDRPPAGVSRREAIALLLLLLFAAWLRIGAVLGTEVIEPIRGDALDYYHYAHNLRESGAYSRTPATGVAGEVPPADAFRRPGYALFILPWIAHPPTLGMLLRIGLLQAALGVALVGLAWWLGRRLVGRGTGWAVGGLCAISPHLVNSAIWLLSEPLFALLVLLALVLAFDGRAAIAGGARLYAAALAFGAAMLTRPTLDYLPWLLVPLALLALPRPRAWRTVAVLALGIATVMGPWWARNLVQFGQLDDRSLAVNTLLHGMYPDFLWEDRPETLAMPYKFDPEAPAIGRSTATVLSALAERASADPARYLRWYLVGKPLSLVAWDEVRIGDAFILSVSATPYFSHPVFLATHLLARLLHWPLMVLAFAGCVLAWRRRSPVVGAAQAAGLRVVSLLLLYVLAVHVAGAPYPRYSVPFRPELYLMACYAAAEAWAWLQGRAMRDKVAA